MSRADKVLKYFREQEAYMEDRIASGIEANRKGWMRLSFVDSEGNPVNNVSVKLEQKSHDFRFGCNLFMLDELETDEKNQKFKDMYPQLFNLATLPFYWANLEPRPGFLRFAKDSPKDYRRPAPDLCLEYCAEKGIEPKLHCLVYDQWSPTWLPEDAQAIKALLDKRISQIAERYADKIPSMEVINETQCSYITGKTDRKSTPFFLEDDIIEWSFDHSRRYLPTNKLIINEATGHIWGERFKYTRSAYYLQIQRALEKGATIDSIGMQYHQFHKKEDEELKAATLLNPERLYQVLDTYANLNKPIQITEVTASAYSWEPEDEYVQAEMIRNLYRIWFSHPNMEAIVYWNMIDGYAAYAVPGDMTNGENKYHGGLLRFDMSKKPAWEALDQLINHEWHTSIDTVCSANADLKGFYGEYELTASVDGKEVKQVIHLKKGNTNNFTITV